MFRSPPPPSAKPGIFDRGWAYRLGQNFLYRSGAQKAYVAEHVRARPGSRVLDVGCGPGIFRELLPAGVRYAGIDPNPAYIESARERWGDSAEFRCGYLDAQSGWEPGSFDLVLLNGVLHHVPDAVAAPLLANCARLLRPGGRFVSRDGCLYDGISRVEKFVLGRDRGEFIRDRESYERLISAHFRITRSEIRLDLLRIPYPLFVAEGEKPA